jgi:hypothetical protein
MPFAVLEEAKALAQAKGLSVSAIMKIALLEFLEKRQGN